MMLLCACGGGGGSGPGAEGSAERKVVRVGMTPFFEYHFLTVAHELGWDKELGLELKFTWLTQSGPAMQAVANGSVDTANTCTVCNYPFYETLPGVSNFITTDQYKGFVVIGRSGQAKTYDEFLKKLGDPEKAKQATIQQFRGSKWPMYSANYKPLLKGMLEQGGMSLDDVNVLNFADDEKSALALVGGTGDFYMGGLPAELNLLTNHPDDFVLVGGQEILGPAGLWYSNIAASNEWLNANETTALKLLAMNYRYNRYIQEDREAVLPIIRDAMNAHSGADLDLKQLRLVFDKFVYPRTYQQAQKETYNPSSEFYWRKSADYYLKQSNEVPDNADPVRNNPLEAWFDKLMQRPALLKWINKPLT